MRTEDRDYGQSYWQSLDGGAGYTDSVVWEDLAHIIQETFGRPATGHQPGLRMLDIGCAAGFLVHHMRRRGVESFGLDYSRYALGLAPAVIAPFLHEYDLTVPQSMLIQPGVPSSLVVCLETLEHIPEPDVPVALENISLALDEYGLAFLSICLNDVPGWDSDPTHITIHDRPWWDQKLSDAGFVSHSAVVTQLRRYAMFTGHNGLFVVTR